MREDSPVEKTTGVDVGTTTNGYSDVVTMMLEWTKRHGRKRLTDGLRRLSTLKLPPFPRFQVGRLGDTDELVRSKPFNYLNAT